MADEKVHTSRFDLKTRVCLMAAFIYGSIDGIEVDEAVEVAVDIENATDARVKKMKKDNPVFPKSQRRTPGRYLRPVYNKPEDNNAKVS